MGGETEREVSGWTVDSLHTHLQKQIDALEKHHDQDIDQLRRETARTLAEKDKASDKSERQMEKRFDSINEFRGQLNDQVKTFLTKETYDVAHEALDGKVDIVQNLITGIVAEKRGAGNQVNAIYALGGFISILLVIGTVLAANGLFG